MAYIEGPNVCYRRIIFFKLNMNPTKTEKYLHSKAMLTNVEYQHKLRYKMNKVQINLTSTRERGENSTYIPHDDPNYIPNGFDGSIHKTNINSYTGSFCTMKL